MSRVPFLQAILTSTVWALGGTLKIAATLPGGSRLSSSRFSVWPAAGCSCRASVLSRASCLSLHLHLSFYIRGPVGGIQPSADLQSSALGKTQRWCWAPVDQAEHMRDKPLRPVLAWSMAQVPHVNRHSVRFGTYCNYFMCPWCIWHFRDGIRSRPVVWTKQMFLPQGWRSSAAGTQGGWLSREHHAARWVHCIAVFIWCFRLSV